jgi:predicted nuclease with TOPRIM domain
MELSSKLEEVKKKLDITLKQKDHLEKELKRTTFEYKDSKNK